jgi:TolA-binding protein
VQPDQPDTKLYTGISYYELQRYEEANDNFNKVIEHNDNMYVEPAEWYLGLCFLAMEDNERARRQFARIASSNHEKAEEAEKLLRKIRR